MDNEIISDKSVKYTVHCDLNSIRKKTELYYLGRSDTEIKSKPYGIYHGQVKDDKREGKGRFIWSSADSKGDIYEGDWKDDKMHGKGLYIYTNGKRYKGDFYKGDMHGKGYMIYTNGYYEGDWVHGNREGKGKFLWTEDPWNGDIYDGGWKNDKRYGKGRYEYANGDIYEGEWKDGKEIGKWKLIKKGKHTQNIKKNDNYWFYTFVSTEQSKSNCALLSSHNNNFASLLA